MLNNMDEEEPGAPGARNDADDQSDADDHMQERHHYSSVSCCLVQSFFLS